MSSKKNQRLEQIITQQESLLLDLKNEIDEIDADGIISENEQLKESLMKIEQKNEQLRKDNEAISRRLEATKASLFAKMANEKLLVFSRAQSKLESIYYIEDSGLRSRLDAYKTDCLESISQMRKRVEAFSQEGYDDLLIKLNELENEINARHTELTARLEQERAQTLDANNKSAAVLRNEGLTETEKRVAVKQKNIEAFIGLNVLSKAGILLFIIGIIALGRFAYVHLPDIFKGIMIFALGGLLIGVGELFHKKESTVFSTVLISGGVAVLYAASATSYFALELYGIKTTFALCIVITAIAIALSAQLKNQIVCAFGAVGGYLPLVATFMIGFGSAAADKAFLPVSAVYFCLLAVIVLIMTYNKHWYAAQYIGYAFQQLAAIGIAKCAWVLRDSTGYEYALPLAAGFAVASFVIYMLMPAIKIIKGENITVSDIVLMGINTLSGAISVGVTTNNCFATGTDGNRAVGVVFLVFSLLYALMLRMSSREREAHNFSAMRGILCGGLFAFSLLVVPFVFGWNYVGIGWAAEGILIALIANNKSSKLFEIIGFACMTVAIPAFVIALNYEFDFFVTSASLFSPIVIITLSIMLASFWAYAVNGIKSNNLAVAFYVIVEIITAAATAAYLIYVYKYAISLPFVMHFCDFTDCAAYALAFAVTVVILKAGVLNNKATQIESVILGVAMLIAVIFADIGSKYNLITNYYDDKVIEIKSFAIFNLVLLAVINAITVMLLSSAVGKLLSSFNLPVWIYTAVISFTSLLLITIVLMNQFDVKFSNVIISALYIAVACVLLVIGFRKRYTVVRTGGLVLILAALAKLCFVDTHALNTGWKIGSYFAFGAVLIIISFFYQRFSKRLEQEAVNYISDKTE